jgi:hypothetical protein
VVPATFIAGVLANINGTNVRPLLLNVNLPGTHTIHYVINSHSQPITEYRGKRGKDERKAKMDVLGEGGLPGSRGGGGATNKTNVDTS